MPAYLFTLMKPVLIIQQSVVLLTRSQRIKLKATSKVRAEKYIS